MHGNTIDKIVVNGIVYEDKEINGSIINCATYPNGAFEYAYTMDDLVYYRKYKNGKIIESRTNNIETNKIDKSDLKEILSVLQNRKSLSSADIQSAINITTTGNYSVNEVNGVLIVSQSPQRLSDLNIGIDDLLIKYPVQYQAYSSTHPFYCTPLNTWKNVIIRDTRDSYVQSSTRNAFLGIGTTVVEIAASIMMSQVNVFTFFSAYLVLGELADALSVSRGIEATSARLRQGFIYDDTYYNRYVSVLTEYGEDNYIVSNQGNGYDWGEIYPTMKDLYPDSYIGSRSAQIYNSNVDMYEYWPHGDI